MAFTGEGTETRDGNSGPARKECLRTRADSIPEPEKRGFRV